MSFFQKARDRAQEAAAHIQQSYSASHDGVGGQGEGVAQQRSSFNVTNALPAVVRHGISSIDPRYEHNRSFHRLSGRIRSTQLEHQALAQQTKGMATATYQWGQDHLPEKREDSVGDEALADVADRLAYTLSLVGDLHVEHAKRLEETRADLKRIQKLEVELAPRRALRIKIHKELMTMIPERAIAHSEKIAPLEDRLKALEKEDKEKEEELAKLKREAMRSSYEGQFDSLIELGEKMAIVARHGKLMLDQLPIYAVPFPTPRLSSRVGEEDVWPNEARLASIRAAIEPALASYKPNLTDLPHVPSAEETSHLSRNSTVKYAESNKHELEEMIKSQESATAIDESVVPVDASRLATASPGEVQPRRSSSSSAMSPLPEGGTLPPNLNLEPTVLRPRLPSHGGTMSPGSPPSLPPRTINDDIPFSTQGSGGDSAIADGPDAHGAAIADAGPTFAETGSPIYSNDPGPKSGVLSPRAKGPPSARMPMPSLPPELASAHHDMGTETLSPSSALDTRRMSSEQAAWAAVPSSSSTTAAGQAKDEEAQRERLVAEQEEIAQLAVAARLRRDGSIVRRGDADWDQAQKEDLPPYSD